MNQQKNSFSSYLIDEGIAKVESTVENYSRYIKKILNEVFNHSGDLPTKMELTKQDIYNIKKWLCRKEHNKRVYSDASLIPLYSAVIAWLKYLGYDDIWGIKWIKQVFNFNHLDIVYKNYSEEILTPQEILLMLNNPCITRRDRAIISVLWFTTMRSKELRGLNLNSIDERTKTITTLNKGGKLFTRALYTDCLDYIKDYIENERKISGNVKRIKRGKFRETETEKQNRLVDITQALFLNKEGTHRLGKTDLAYMLKNRALEVGITKRIYPHNFRRSAITYMDKCHWTDKQKMDLSGHKDAKTINKFYTQYNNKEKQELVNDTFDKMKQNTSNTSEDEIKSDPVLKAPVKSKTSTQIVKQNRLPKNKRKQFMQLYKKGYISYEELQNELEESNMENSNNHMYH